MKAKLKAIREKCADFRVKQQEFAYGKEVAGIRASEMKSALEQLLWEIEER